MVNNKLIPQKISFENSGGAAHYGRSRRTLDRLWDFQKLFCFRFSKFLLDKCDLIACTDLISRQVKFSRQRKLMEQIFSANGRIKVMFLSS